MVQPVVGSVLHFTGFRSFLFFRRDETVKSSKKKSIKHTTIRCPYCGAPAVYRSADGIYLQNKNNTMLYVCANYPQCDSYVRVHPGTRTPVGSMADKKLRSMRKTAHQYFDQLHQTGIMSKKEAYLWLANLIDAPLSEAHIGYLGLYYCGLVIEESKKLVDTHLSYINVKEAAPLNGVECRTKEDRREKPGTSP